MILYFQLIIKENLLVNDRPLLYSVVDLLYMNRMVLAYLYLSMNLLSLMCCIFMAYLENYTEELLSIHEHQVEVMKNYYEENKNIFKLVERREALFKTMEEFEVT